MPGTHCKWGAADAEQIMIFRTVMTGELHHLLLKHSLGGAGLPEQHPPAGAVAAGLERGLSPPADFAAPLRFAPRTCWEIFRANRSANLSGLPMAQKSPPERHVGGQQTITLVAGSSLTSRYRQAFHAIERDVARWKATRHFRQA
ncbi:2-dehydro-3-deoxygalactonokinase [Shigella flexneri]